MNTVKSLSTIRTASRCFIKTPTSSIMSSPSSSASSNASRKFNALSNNPVFYSQLTYNKIAADYNLQHPMVNNNGADLENSNTEVEGEKLYINNSHLHKQQHVSNSTGEKFEPIIYSPEDDVHSIGGNIIS